jgi:MinD-like ATPase involved in chromosome partitioning or flagellar assembly
MVTLCWAAKGGSGTTVTAAVLAMVERSATLLVDLDGEIPRVLGLPGPDRPGLADWLGSDAPEAHLDDLLIDVDDHLRVLPWRASTASTSLDPLRDPVERFSMADPDRRQRCLSWLSSRVRERVIIDAGTGEPSTDLLKIADTRLLVTRPCYLAVQRALHADAQPTGIALIDEPGHSLSKRDIQRSLGVPVVATLSLDPAISRAVDAGLLTVRLPAGIRRELRGAA